MLIEKQQSKIAFWEGARIQDKSFNALTGSAVLMAGQNDTFRKKIDYANVIHGMDIMNHYFERIQDERQKIIRMIMLTLNNYERSLGLGLMSATVNLLDKDGNSILSEDESKNPTIGIRPNLKSGNRKIVGFPISEGGEELTALSPVLSAAEYKQDDFGVNNELPLQHLAYSENILVPTGGVVGVPFDITDMDKLIASGLPFAEIEKEKTFRSENVGKTPIAKRENTILTPEALDYCNYMTEEMRRRDLRNPLEAQQVYLCRYLTEAAVKRALAKKA